MRIEVPKSLFTFGTREVGYGGGNWLRMVGSVMRGSSIGRACEGKGYSVPKRSS